jgi:hypothetical protein
MTPFSRAGFAFFAFFAFFAGNARAESREEEAAQHFERALVHVDRREYEAAIGEFQKAHELSPNHSVHYNIGMAYASAGKPSRALRAFESYLAEGGAEIPRERQERVAVLIRNARDRLGRLRIHAEPARATLKIDGEAMPLDAAGLELDAGEHVLLLGAPGFVERTWSVSIRAKETLEVLAVLVPQSPRSLRVRCSVPDARVALDGRTLAMTSGDADVAVRDVPADARMIAFERAGYDRHVVDVQALGQEHVTDCRLVPQRAAMTAQLQLQISEPAASVSIDGAPYRGGPLVPGRHWLVVRCPECEPFSRMISLDAARPLTLPVVLMPTPTRRQESARRAKARRTQAYVVGSVGLVLGAAALGTKIYADQLYDDWHGEQARLPLIGAVTTPEQRARQARNDELEGTIRTLDKVAVGMGIGAALALGGAVWWYFSGSDDPQQGKGAAFGVVGSTLAFQSTF